MPSITIRNLDDSLKAKLRTQAAHHGHSMEDEARDILRAALSRKRSKSCNLTANIRSRFAKFRGVDLPQPPRQPVRRPVKLEP